MLLLLLGCAGTDQQPSWRDQLQPAGPCWEVSLSDGLDTSSTDELHALFDCFNQNSNLDPLQGPVDAMDTTARSGVPLGVELADLVNALPGLGIDVFGLAGFGITLLQEEPTLATEGLEIAVELIYGQPYAEITVSGPVSATSALDQGVIRPVLPVLAQAAGAILDDGNTLPTMLADALSSQATADAICLAVGLQDSPSTTALATALLPDLGEAIGQARESKNDLWADASGDSLRDVIAALALTTRGDGQTLLQSMQDDLLVILQDEALLDRLLSVLDDIEAGGHLDPLPPQLLYLATVDVSGQPITAGQDSALLSMLRMLHAANDTMSCTVDIAGIELLQLDIDNLSVQILRLLAQQSPEDVAGGLELLGGVLDWGITDSVMDTVVDSGVCPMLTAQLVSDLDSINRLSDPEAADLVVVLLELLGAFYQEDLAEDRTSSLVNILATVYAREAVPPIEEVMRDLAASAFVDDLTDLLPAMLSVDDLQTTLCPTGAAPLDLHGLLTVMTELITPDDGQTPLEAAEPLLHAILNHENTWLALGNLGFLLTDEDARIQQAADLTSRLIALDPELSLLYDSVDLLEEPTLIQPLLKIAESDALVDAMGQTALTEEGPLPFFSRLIMGGTLEDVLRTVDVLLDAFAAP